MLTTLQTSSRAPPPLPWFCTRSVYPLQLHLTLFLNDFFAACVLTFLTLLVSVFTFRQAASRLTYLITLGVGILAALFTTIVFLIDVILVAVVRNHVNDQTDGDLTLNWGNAVWMCLGATIALWLALTATCTGVCGCGRRFRFAILLFLFSSLLILLLERARTCTDRRSKLNYDLQASAGHRQKVVRMMDKCIGHLRTPCIEYLM